MNLFFDFFKKSDFKKAVPIQFEIINRKKLVTFVPLKYLDKLTYDLSSAGAGNIGDYSVCSFRTKGIGTFKPALNSKPFSGKKGELSFEEEIKLEMEFDKKDMNNIIDTLFSSHPYEEPAYEIYDFQKRGKNPVTYFVELKNKIDINSLLTKLNKKLNIKPSPIKKSITKLIITSDNITDELISLTNEHKADCIISIKNFKINLKLL